MWHNNHFPKFAMARFSEQFKDQNLVSMHNTNPEPFSQKELELTIGQSFAEIVQDVNLGFAPDVGTQSLRQSVAENLYQGVTSKHVVTHAGAQEALFCAFHALLKSGDKVLTIAPIFEPLLQIPLNIGCDVRFVHLDECNNWSLNIDKVEAEFQLGCRLFVINFPHNPTGVTVSEVELMEIIALCQKYNVWLLSDEVFRGLEHSSKYQLPAVADVYDKGISIGAISKAFAVPGLRVGWLVCQNQDLLNKVLNVKGYLSICNSQIDEIITSNLLGKANDLLKHNLNIVLKNKKLLGDIKSIYDYKVEVFIPDAGCCVFAILKNAQVKALDSVDVSFLVKDIAQKSGYLLYPSSLFKTEIAAIRIGFGSHNFSQFVQHLPSL